jgi:methylenetetrahydrofolate reductase (NADPH)
MSFLISDSDKFVTTIEVVPPAGNDPQALLDKLAGIAPLDFHGFSVATNPVAKPRMSAMAFCYLLTRKTGKPSILHMTVRDHNLLGSRRNCGAPEPWASTPLSPSPEIRRQPGSRTGPRR